MGALLGGLVETGLRLRRAVRLLFGRPSGLQGAQHSPSSTIAGMAGFKTKAFFEIDDEAIQAPVNV